VVKQHRFKGNAIVEYALPSACVVCLSILGFQAIGANFNGMFNSLNTDIRSHVNAAQTAQDQHATNAAIYNVAGSLSPNSPTQICNSSGQCAPLGSAINLQSAVQTTGANGTIGIMGDKLRLIAAQLLANKQITPAQANQFVALSNQGYFIGQISGLVEKTAKSCGTDNNCYNSARVTLQGKLYSMSQLTAMIGYKPLAGTSTMVNSPALEKLWALYGKLPPAVFSDPLLTATIKTLTDQIGQTSGLVEMGSKDVQTGVLDPNAIHDYLVSRAKGAIPGSGLANGQSAQGSVNNDSKGICLSGNNTATGASCH
jgi:hypothetical protein